MSFHIHVLDQLRFQVPRPALLSTVGTGHVQWFKYKIQFIIFNVKFLSSFELSTCQALSSHTELAATIRGQTR